MSYTDGLTAGDMRSEKDAREKFTTVELWLKKIEHTKECKKRESWMKDAKNAVTLYEAGEVFAGEAAGVMDQLSGANLWHANIETIVPALYNSKPLPDVRVRYGDPNPIQKAVCDMTERALTFDLDSYDYDDEIKEVVRQAELTGWGIPRVKYKPTVVHVKAEPAATGASSVPEDGVADGETTPPGYDDLVKDDVPVECHPWDRFLVSPARSFTKATWIAFEHDMTLDQIDDLAPAESDEETGEMVPVSARFSPDKSSKDDDGSRSDTDPRPDNPGIINTITVYEIWDKRTKRVLFITDKDKKRALRDEEDPFDGAIPDFFPVPKILYSKRRTSSIQPISPWTVYKGLFQEFEDITKRINGLVSQIKVRGFYDKEMEADFELLKNCEDGEYVPAKAVGQFTSGSKGMDGAIHHWPLQELMVALKEAVDHRERTKQLIFETTGLSDILRGATNANETLGAQKIKASWGSQRIQDMQQDVAELNRAVIRMKAQIRAKLTPWPLLKEISGMDFAPQMPEPPQPAQPQAATSATGDPQQDAMAAQQAQMQEQQKEQEAQAAFQAAQEKAIADAQQFEQQVEQAFRAQSRIFRIDIETDSTIRADMARDQEQMNLFVQSTGTFVQAIAGLVQIMPETRQAMFKLYAAQASKFKLGRQGEAALDELVQAAAKPPASGATSDPQAQAHEQQMAQQQGAQQQAAQDHEAKQTEKQQAHEQTMAQHDATTQQTAIAQIQLKNQGQQAKHANDLEFLQVQRALPPKNGAMAQEGAF